MPPFFTATRIHLSFSSLTSKYPRKHKKKTCNYIENYVLFIFAHGPKVACFLKNITRHTTPFKAIAYFFISMQVLFKEILYLNLIIWQLLWAYITNVLQIARQ
jgi:hypothetical protein